MIRAQLRELRKRLVLSVHGSGLQVLGSPSLEMTDQPIPPAWIDEGAPQARASCAVRSADGRMMSGEWSCTAGRFTWTYYDDEFIRILAGEAFIEIEGVFRRFGPGDSVFFPLGQSARWHVPDYVHKVFFLSRPGRLVEFLRAFSIPGLRQRAPRSPEAARGAWSARGA